MKLSLALITLCIAQTAAFSVQRPSMHSSMLASSSGSREYDTAMQQSGAAGDRADVRKQGTTSAPPQYDSAMQQATVGNAPLENVNAGAPRDLWDESNPVTVQGGSLRTWSFSSASVKRVKVSMKTDGRPLNANLDLWQGPDNAPQKMSVFVEDGSARTFSAVIETPRGQNAIALRNTGQMEFPLDACVEADVEDASGNSSSGLGAAIQGLADMSKPEVVQGGAIKTYSFDPAVASVQVMLKTDGRPLNARIELLQGPNTNKQVIELYTEDGMDRPFFAVIETPGVGNVVRIVNTAPVEFPMSARVEPYMIAERREDTGGVWNSGALFGGR